MVCLFCVCVCVQHQLLRKICENSQFCQKMFWTLEFHLISCIYRREMLVKFHQTGNSYHSSMSLRQCQCELWYKLPVCETSLTVSIFFHYLLDLFKMKSSNVPWFLYYINFCVKFCSTRYVTIRSFDSPTVEYTQLKSNNRKYVVISRQN